MAYPNTGMGLQKEEEELGCLSICPKACMGNIVTYVHAFMCGCVGNIVECVCACVCLGSFKRSIIPLLLAVRGILFSRLDFSAVHLERRIDIFHKIDLKGAVPGLADEYNRNGEDM